SQLGQFPKNFGSEGGKKAKPGARIFVRSTSFGCRGGCVSRPVFAAAYAATIATSRKNFFAKRRMRAGRCNAVDGGLTSPTLGVGGNLLCEIVQFGLFRGAHPSRMRASASRDRELFLQKSTTQNPRF